MMHILWFYTHRLELDSVSLNVVPLQFFFQSMSFLGAVTVGESWVGCRWWVIAFYAGVALGSGRIVCRICGWMSLSFISNSSLIPYFLFAPPHTSHTAHLLVVTPISSLVSCREFFSLCSGMRGMHPSPNMKPAGLEVILVALRR